MSVRVVLADDHAIVREGLRSLLDATGGFVVVEAVGTAAEAIRSAVTHRPEVLVLDIGLPDMSGLDAAAQIARLAPDVRVLMLTMFDDDDDTVAAAIRIGVAGYVLKGAAPEDIIRAIGSVARDDFVLGSGVSASVLARAIDCGARGQPFPDLTAREREVQELLASGLGNASIAARLSISSNTVGNHVTSILAKLQVSSRAEAIVVSRRAGMGG
jgi:DNA-binding NarL/FixJ family response regulator